MTANYAWIVDRDHLAEEFGDEPDTGITGPHDAPDDLLDRLKSDANAGYTFRLFDDDRKHYYTGRLITTGDPLDVCMAPLDDFGTGWAGCTDVQYPGRPDMNGP